MNSPLKANSSLSDRGALMRLGPLLVMTPDLGVALDFYGRILALPLLSRSETQLIFDIGGGSLHVFECDRAAVPQQHGSDAASVISFEVADLGAAMTRLQARGVAFLHERPARNELAGMTYAAFHAPGGNIHELVQRGNADVRQALVDR